MLHVGVCCSVVSVSCSFVVTCWERADLLAVVFVVFFYCPKCVLVHIRIKGEVGAVMGKRECVALLNVSSWGALLNASIL